MAPRARGMRKSLHTPEYLAFCDLMTQTRKKAGLTQRALAKRLGRPQSFVAKYEGGERRLDVIEFVTVARAIGTDPVLLLRTLSKRRS
jgi:transcriptional regulator with XRE-family HTH domain